MLVINVKLLNFSNRVIGIISLGRLLPSSIADTSELISKFNVGLKPILHQGLTEPECYGDFVYKFKKIMGMTYFSDQFRKIIIRHKRIGYDLNVMQQSACLVVNPSRLITLLYSLIAHRCIGHKTL